MNVTSVEKKEKSTVELVVQVGAEEFEAAVEKAYRKNRGQISVPGFRKGKAPRKIIESMYGSGIFYEDAVNELYPSAYAQAVADQNLDDVGYPQVEITSVGKEGFTFKALVSVRPEVKLGAYKGLTAPKEEVKVTDEDIQEELKPYIDRATRLVTTQEAAASGDTAVIDFEGFMAGEAFDGGKGENYSLELGSGTFIPGFEEQVVGMKAGEEKDLHITFPQDYVPELAGKDVVFKVKVKEVKHPVRPEVDDEFAKDVSEFETLDAFKKDLADKLQERRTQSAQREYEEAVMTQLIANMEAEIPDAMVDVQVDRMMDEYASRVTSQGISFQDYLKMVGMNEEMVRSGARPSALRQVQLELALSAVADAEDIQISDEEVSAEIARLAKEYSLEEDKVRAVVSDADLRRDLRLKKANELVLENAKVGKAKKAAAKKAPKKEEESAEQEDKPAKKTTRRKKAESEEGGETEEKSTKKSSAKKSEKKAEE